MIITSSYQASIQGFQRELGETACSRERAIDLLKLTVKLATRARDTFWNIHTNRSGRMSRPLVAASIGYVTI
jgi:homocysteine S-methyltransferase